MMSGFEYLIALVSVVAGLSLTRALSGLAKTIHLRGEIRFSAVHFVWTASLLLWLIDYWWFTFLLAPVEQWTMPLFLFVLVYGAIIYFLIALLFPDNLDSGIDLFEHFLKSRRWFFGTFIGLGVLDLVDSWTKTYYGVGTPPKSLYTVFIAVWLLLGIFGAIATNLNYHRAIAFTWLTVIVSFTALFISGSPIF